MGSAVSTTSMVNICSRSTVPSGVPHAEHTTPNTVAIIKPFKPQFSASKTQDDAVAPVMSPSRETLDSAWTSGNALHRQDSKKKQYRRCSKPPSYRKIVGKYYVLLLVLKY